MKLKGETTYEVPLRYYLVLAPVIFLIKLWQATVRFKYSEESFKYMRDNRRVIALIWHNRIFITPMLKKRFHNDYRMCGLVSPSKDGAWLSAAFKLFGVETVRGSSKRRGAVAIKELVKAIHGGCNVCITPDGPQGPKYSIKKGALTVAELSGANILMMRAKYRHFFTIGTWDKFMFPLPFSTVDLEVEPIIDYEEVCKRAEADGIEPEKYVQKILGGD